MFINSTNLTLNPLVTPPGAYSLFACISDGTHARYLYAPEHLAVDPSRRAPGLYAPSIRNGSFGFTISGFPGQIIIVQTSTNLVQWNPLATNTLTGTTLGFTDIPDAGRPHRFYRAMLGP